MVGRLGLKQRLGGGLYCAWAITFTRVFRFAVRTGLLARYSAESVS